MQIYTGNFYLNRTFKYLYPALTLYGNELIDKLRILTKLAVGIGDSSIHIEKQCIYVLLDTTTSNISFDSYRIKIQQFLEWIREQPYYISDYLCNLSEYNNYHMVVIEFPRNHHTIFNNFIKGRYSRMYTREEIYSIFGNQKLENKTNEIIVNKKLEEIRNVLLRDRITVKKHLGEVNKDFNSKLTLEDFKEPLEADYPIKLSEEIFNYEKIKDDLWN